MSSEGAVGGACEPMCVSFILFMESSPYHVSWHPVFFQASSSTNLCLATDPAQTLRHPFLSLPTFCFCIWSQALDPTVRHKSTSLLYPISYQDGKLHGHSQPAHIGTISLPGSEFQPHLGDTMFLLSRNGVWNAYSMIEILGGAGIHQPTSFVSLPLG
jgi:hypothetical protein